MTSIPSYVDVETRRLIRTNTATEFGMQGLGKSSNIGGDNVDLSICVDVGNCRHHAVASLSAGERRFDKA